MRYEIRKFWRNLLERLNDKINQILNKGIEKAEILDADADNVVNFFAMVLKKVKSHLLLIQVNKATTVKMYILILLTIIDMVQTIVMLIQKLQ